MNLITLLDDAIETLFNKLDKLDPTSQEYGTVNKNLNQLMSYKLEVEKHLAAEAQNEKKLAEERKAQYRELVVDILKFLLQLGFSIVGVLLAFTFEEKGTITSGIGKRLYDGIVKRK